ncbi:ABC transporter permease [Cuniculiplasma sp. SKW4]|uniref:ABC transporter permease n=1 Tax=Cuniculiplasma sp. SKW4 TaxID=3400171 RepID=UPI003FD028DB
MNEKKNKYAIINPPIYWKRLYKQFTIFYKSKYGKAGFYILLAFAVVTMLAPYVGGNVGYYTSAPAIDSTLASPIANISLYNETHSNGYFYGPMSSSVEPEGYTGAVYVGNSDGTVYYIGLGQTGTPLGTVGEIYNSSFNNSNEKMLRPVLFDLINGRILSNSQGFNVVINRFVILPYTNNTLTVGEIEYRTDGNFKSPHFVYLYNIKLNGSIVGNITTNAIAFDNSPTTPMPEYFYNSQADFTNGQMYVVTKNKTGTYLNEFDVLPFSHVLTFKINMKNVAGVKFYGKQLYLPQAINYSRLLVYNDSSVISFASYNGTMMWQDNFTKINTQNGLLIPSFYQVSLNSYNSVYLLANGDDVYSINLETGVSKLVYSYPYQTYSISTSQGESGLPTYIIGMSSNYFQILSYNLTLKNYTFYEVPFSSAISGEVLTHGVYDAVTNSLIFVAQKGVALSFNDSANSSATAFLWSYTVSPTPTNVSSILYFSNSYTGKGAIAFTTSAGYIYIIGSTASSYAPLPPMIKTPTGQSYPFGTTFFTKADLWSRFLQSFYNDWIFGISIGFFSIVISLAVAMYVGYKGGLGGQIIETMSLALFLVPTLALLIALSSVIPGNANFIDLILIVSLTGWPFAAFTLIGVVRGVSSRSFVEASKLFGSNTASIMRRHILPNIGPLLLYLLALSIGGGIGAVSGLEFLGLAPLNTATWGGMLNAVLKDEFYLITEPQWIIPPAIALSMFIFSLIFVSRGMDEVVNPRLRRR